MKIYEKDQNAYYNGDSLSISQKNAPINEANSKDANERYLTNYIYKKDQRPYYSPTPEYNIIKRGPNDKIITPIELKDDLLDTASTYENLRNLEKTLNNLNKKEDLNSISLSGKYMRDPKAYYDAGEYGRNLKKQSISEAIDKIKGGLYDNSVDYSEENYKEHTQIQNYQNFNREHTNEFIENTYYYDPKSII